MRHLNIFWKKLHSSMYLYQASKVGGHIVACYGYWFFFFLRFFYWLRFRFMVFNVTFNNISVISWRSALMVEETRAREENHRPVASYWPTLSRNVISITFLLEFENVPTVWYFYFFYFFYLQNQYSFDIIRVHQILDSTLNV